LVNAIEPNSKEVPKNSVSAGVYILFFHTRKTNEVSVSQRIPWIWR
jgi:hypothetical protein